VVQDEEKEMVAWPSLLPQTRSKTTKRKRIKITIHMAQLPTPNKNNP
jgi:hypothetical protein